MHVAETERSENTYKLMYRVHCLQAEAMPLGILGVR